MTTEEAATLLAELVHVGAVSKPANPQEAGLTAVAWANVLHATMPLGQAQEAARTCAGERDGQFTHITPGQVNSQWIHNCRVDTARRNADSHVPHDSHCGRQGCICTHTGGCHRGWMEHDPDRAVPCRECRASLVLRLSQVPEPARREAHHGRILRGGN